MKRPNSHIKRYMPRLQQIRLHLDRNAGDGNQIVVNDPCIWEIHHNKAPVLEDKSDGRISRLVCWCCYWNGHCYFSCVNDSKLASDDKLRDVGRVRSNLEYMMDQPLMLLEKDLVIS